jgi:hypothetical protein
MLLNRFLDNGPAVFVKFKDDASSLLIRTKIKNDSEQRHGYANNRAASATASDSEMSGLPSANVVSL